MIEFFKCIAVSSVEFLQYMLLDWSLFFRSSLTVISLVTALMGIIKTFKPFSCIKNEIVKNVVLSWLSIVLTVALTSALILLGHGSITYLVWSCAFNSLVIILTYWLYKSTALRDVLALAGTKLLSKIKARKPKTVAEVKDLSKELTSDVEALLNPEKSTSEGYSEEDLKNL